MVCVLDLLPSTRFVPRRSPTPQALFSLSLTTPTGIKARNSPAARRHAPGGNPSATTTTPAPSSPPPLLHKSGGRSALSTKPPLPRARRRRRCSGGLRTAPPSSSANLEVPPVSPVRLLPAAPSAVTPSGVPASVERARALEFAACLLCNWKSGLLVRTARGSACGDVFSPPAAGWFGGNMYQSRPASVSCPPVEFC